MGLLGLVGFLFFVEISCVSCYESLPCVFGLGLPCRLWEVSHAVIVRSCYDLYEWYFPDVLWDRQVLFVFVMGWSTSCTAVRLGYEIGLDLYIV